jgi:hypothetical protein
MVRTPTQKPDQHAPVSYPDAGHCASTCGVSPRLSNPSTDISAYHKEHPDATPKQISETLAKNGIEVNAGRVSGVLRGNGGQVDVETIREAAAFVAGYAGKMEDALAAVSMVGGFVEACGGAKKAKETLEAYKAVVEAVRM